MTVQGILITTFLHKKDKWPCLESIAINKLLWSKHTDKQVDTSMKDRDQINLTTSKFQGRK